jgi:hypothetical protein
MGNNGEIIFQTNSDELKADILSYINNCIDAIKWRRRVESVSYIYTEERGD